MTLAGAVREAVRNVLGPAVIRYIRHIGVAKVQNAKQYLEPLANKRALEIGGPSDIFAYDGSVPVYPVLAGVDNCLFSYETMWTGRVSGRFFYDAQRRQGTQFICEATNLEPIADSSYDCVLASHCLEHTANPMKALKEFQRILKPDGLLLAVLPHKDATFDWRRPVTPLSHIQEDYANNVAEDDRTHLAEVLALHDIAKDGALTETQFRERCLHNVAFRIMHHHTFNTASAVALIESAGFKIVHFENVKPYHIVILAQPAPQPSRLTA